MPSAPAPRSANRLIGLDIARGLAVLGMVTAHVGMIGKDLSSFDGWLSVANGRSSILFATLAGVSLGILTGGRTPYSGVAALQARTRILVRSALLLVVGGALALLGTYVSLIVAYYAVWFVLALPFTKLRARTLLILGPIVGVLGAVAIPYVGDLLYRFGFDTEVGNAHGLVPEVMLAGTYPGLMWMGFVLTGLGLSRLDPTKLKTLVTMVIAGAFFAVVGYGGSALLQEVAEVAMWEGSDYGVPIDDSGSVEGDKTVDSDGWIYKDDGTTHTPDGYVMDGDQVFDPDGVLLTEEKARAFWAQYESTGDNKSVDEGKKVIDGKAPFDGEKSEDGTWTDEDGWIYKADGTQLTPEGFTIDKSGVVFHPDGTALTKAEEEAFWDNAFGEGDPKDGPRFDTESPWPNVTLLVYSDPHSSTPFEFLGSGGVAVAVLGLCLMAPLWLRRILTPLAAVGSMSLTAYCAHVIAIYGWPGFFGNGDEGNLPLLVLVGVLLVACTIWSLTLGRGPLERLLRTISMRSARID